jgi:2-hydroxy-6-oxo-octa-2,4-dienoate hydrolase
MAYMTISSSTPLQPFERRDIAVDGRRTSLLEAGDGAPILLLHGSGPGVSAASNWSPVIGALASRFRVIAFDFTGFGESEQVSADQYDIKLWQRQLIGVLDTLGLESVPMVGNSFGGAMALAAAMRHPERVSQLVLMGTPVGDYPLTPGLRGAREFDGTRENLRAILERFPYDTSMISEAMIDSRIAAATRPGAIDALKALIPEPASEGETIIHGIPETYLGSVKTPTLILHGREDRVVPFELGLRLLQGIDDAELHAFGRCGHWVQVERTDDFVRLTTEFLERRR